MPGRKSGLRAAIRPAPMSEKVLVRLSAELHNVLVLECQRTGEDLAEAARRHIRASLTGDVTTQRLDQIEERLDRIQEAQDLFLRSSFPESIGALQNRLAEVGASTARAEDQIAGLGTLFRQGFEKLAAAFLKLQDFVVPGDQRK